MFEPLHLMARRLLLPVMVQSLEERPCLTTCGSAYRHFNVHKLEIWTALEIYLGVLRILHLIVVVDKLYCAEALVPFWQAPSKALS